MSSIARHTRALHSIHTEIGQLKHFKYSEKSTSLIMRLKDANDVNFDSRFKLLHIFTTLTANNPLQILLAVIYTVYTLACPVVCDTWLNSKKSENVTDTRP